MKSDAEFLPSASEDLSTCYNVVLLFIIVTAHRRLDLMWHCTCVCVHFVLLRGIIKVIKTHRLWKSRHIKKTRSCHISWRMLRSDGFILVWLGNLRFLRCEFTAERCVRMNSFVDIIFTSFSTMQCSTLQYSTVIMDRIARLNKACTICWTPRFAIR